MWCCCASETEEKQFDVSGHRPPIVEVQKTFADEDEESPVFSASLSRSHGLLGISVDRSDTNCVVIRDVTGGAAGAWNQLMPHKEIQTFAASLWSSVVVHLKGFGPISSPRCIPK